MKKWFSLDARPFLTDSEHENVFIDG